MEFLVAAAIFIPGGLVYLSSGLLVNRGIRFWGTWMMLIGAVLYFLGILGYIAFGVLASQRGNIENFIYITEAIGWWISVVVPLILSIGFFGVCRRWHGIASKAKELEARAAELARERDENLRPNSNELV